MRRNMFTAVCVVMVVLLLTYSQQVATSCTTCSCEHFSCSDTYSGSYQDACGSAVDFALCRKYDDCYEVKCREGSTLLSCRRDKSLCNQAVPTPSRNVPTAQPSGSSGVINQPCLALLLLICLAVKATAY